MAEAEKREEEYQAMLKEEEEYQAMKHDEVAKKRHIAFINHCKHGNTEAAENLINDGANVNMRGTKEEKLYPLYWASRGGHTETAEMLVRRGAKLDPICNNSTALGIAAFRGHTDTVKKLGEMGADFNKSPSCGGTPPLWDACEKGHTQTAEALLDMGADIDGHNNWHNYYTAADRPALYVAMQQGHSETAEMLLARGATPIPIDCKVITPEEDQQNRDDYLNTLGRCTVS